LFCDESWNPKQNPKKNEPHRLLTLFFFPIYPQKEVDGNGSTGRNDYLCLKSGEQHDITQLAAASFQKVSPGKETQNSISGKNSKT
jgi:hypothetical protein